MNYDKIKFCYKEQEITTTNLIKTHAARTSLKSKTKINFHLIHAHSESIENLS